MYNIQKYIIILFIVIPNQPIIRNIGSYAFDEQKITAPIFCLKASNIIQSAFIYIVEH